MSKVWEIGPYFRETMGPAGDAVVTLPQHFRLNGFHTTGCVPVCACMCARVVWGDAVVLLCGGYTNAYG